MNTSSPTTPKPRQPPSFLFIGPPGGGKSEMILQFPGLYIADCDLNLNGPERHLRDDLKLPLTYKYDLIPFDDEGKPVAAADRWPRLISCVEKAVKDPDVKIIAVDTLSHVDEYIKQHILKQQNRPHGVMERQDWIPFRSCVLRLIMTMRLSGKWSILACHEEYKQDEKGNVVRNTPAMSSKITDYFGGFFTDMWRFWSTPAPGNKQHFYVRCYPSSLNELKNAFGVPLEDIELLPGKGFTTMNKWLKFV